MAENDATRDESFVWNEKKSCTRLAIRDRRPLHENMALEVGDGSTALP